VNVHGFWNKKNAKDKVDRTVYRDIPRVPPGRPDPYKAPQRAWYDHPDRDAVARAKAALGLKLEPKT
jgi:hypothetical protein